MPGICYPTIPSVPLYPTLPGVTHPSLPRTGTYMEGEGYWQGREYSGVVPVGMEVMVPGYSLYYTLGIPVYNPGYRIHTYPGAVGHLSIGSSILPGIPGVP